MRSSVQTLWVRLLCLTLAGIIMAQALGQTELASLLFTLTFVLTFGGWAVMAWKGISGCNVLAVVILAVSCIHVMLNALLTGTAVSFSYFRKLIMFWSTVLLLGTMGEYRAEEPDVRFVFRWNTLLACFLIGMFCLQREQIYLLNGRVSVYLTFRFTNPNLAAVFLCAVCMIEWIHGAAEKRGKRFLHCGFAAILAFFVFETRSRNAQLMLFLFLLVYGAVLLFPKWRPRMGCWMAGGIAVFPFVFAAGYLWLVDTPFARELFSFLIGEGKGLDSRWDIWHFALDAFRASPLIGAYSQISGGTGASQMHNSHLDILASYGAPVLVLVCILLFWVLYDGEKPGKGRISFLCKTGFASLLFSGLGEAMLFSGGMGVYLFGGILLMLANFHFESGG